MPRKVVHGASLSKAKYPCSKELIGALCDCASMCFASGEAMPSTPASYGSQILHFSRMRFSNLQAPKIRQRRYFIATEAEKFLQYKENIKQ